MYLERMRVRGLRGFLVYLCLVGGITVDVGGSGMCVGDVGWK